MAAGKRKEGETFKAYRSRLKSEQAQIDRMAQGRIIWQSTFSDPNGLVNLAGRTARRMWDRSPAQPHYY